ncbi:hypothetical protein DN820_01755 [Stutzerimonas nosocomialis]|uniref:Uncharacterized protein n=1 Tax=Stutzerimonas nosocomialis TaxID=1056496 RepID=A0A5R9QIF0_9GAMM|nr:hypothetical protein [Stutzerimonas nosocomialis]TLX65064.1 hypothetical protein DN820_01755 [Stutzerimonas nosocomialis]
MPFPNTPLDPEIEVWGWPWHGLVESEISATTLEGLLTLPSGRTMTIQNARDANDTHLWDIGLPDVEVETTDPDEQWLGKAIIRSHFSGQSRSAWCYGGRSFLNGYPIHVPGQGVLQRSLFIGGYFSGAVDMSLSVNGYQSVNNSFTLAQVGIDAAIDVTGLAIHVMDESPDGTSTLMRVIPYAGSGAQLSYYVGRSIIRVNYEVGDALAITVEVLAPYSSMVYEYAEDPPAANFDSLNMTLWEMPDGTFQERRSSEGSPGQGAQSVARRGQGTGRNHFLYDAPCWAWYRADGSVEVIRYRETEEITSTYGGSFGSISPPSTASYRRTSHKRLRVYSGARFGELESINDAGWDVVSNGVQMTGPGFSSLTVAGQQAWQHSYTATSSWLTWSPMQGVPLANPRIGTNPELAGVGRLSNKVLAPCIRDSPLGWEASAGAEHIYGSALTPSGLDQGIHRINRAAPGAVAFGTGSYNPITGQTVRHRTDKYVTWV